MPAGYVDEFTPDGSRRTGVSRARRTRRSNAPWGLAMAPATSVSYRGDLLVGNFGNGRISAYSDRGAEVGLQGPASSRAPERRSTIDGLWAIAFGNGAAAGPTNSLYFDSGPSEEAHGLFGSITAG